jgi:alkylhydroperoxidase family enzyme
MSRVPYQKPLNNGLEKNNRTANSPKERWNVEKDPIAINWALANSPKASKALLQLGDFIRFRSNLDPRLREMAILQVAYQSRSSYEWSHHIRISKDFGVTDADIKSLIAESTGTNSSLRTSEKALLLAARECVDTQGISEETFKVLSAYLNTELLIDLVLTITTYCAIAKLIYSLDINVEPNYQQYLELFPLPK